MSRRGAAGVFAACLLAAGSCALQPGAPEPTLCERPARPAASLHDPAVEASFRAFARDWLARLRRAGATAPGGRREIRDEFETELRPTGDARAPWVGVLRYCEEALRCAGARCEPARRTVVTELFRFHAGKWVD